MSDVVLFAERETASGQKLGTVTLNVEKTLNSLSLEMIDLMAPRLQAWLQDDSIAAVMFDAAGERAFSAGGDIQNLYHDMKEHPGGPCPYCDQFFEREYRLDHLIQTYAKPTIAWGHGIVMGGGLGVMSACKFRIGTQTTRIAMPEITIGLFPDAGATIPFSKMAPHWSHFLAWTGANINAEDARVVGLIDSLVNHEHKAAFVDGLLGLDELNESSIAPLVAGFEDQSSDFPASQLLQHEAVIAQTTEAALKSSNPSAEFAAQCDKLTGDKWLDRAAASYRGGSPVTAAIIPEQLKRAASMTREQMFQMEMMIAVQCSRHPEFAEGVRALLIEKDGNPAWMHPMGEVPAATLEEFFTPPWDTNPLADL